MAFMAFDPKIKNILMTKPDFMTKGQGMSVEEI